MDAAGLLHLVTCRPIQLHPIQWLGLGCEEAKGVEVAANNRSALDEGVHLLLSQAERGGLTVPNVVATVDHRPLVDSVAPQVRVLPLCGKKQVQHGPLPIQVLITQLAGVVADQSVVRPVQRRTEALPRLGRVGQDIYASRMPGLQLARRIRVVLKEEVVDRVRLSP